MKAYSIHSKQSLIRSEWSEVSIGVQNGKWCAMRDLNKHTCQMNTDSLWMSPGKVYVDLEFPLYKVDYLAPLVRRFIYRGCTCIVTQVPIYSKREMKETYFAYIDELEGIAIDYMVVPRIPLIQLDASVIRFFGLQKVPFIIVEVTHKEDLLSKSWQWIAQAQHPSFIPIVPVYQFDEDTVTYKDWLKIAKQFGVRTLPKPLDEKPLSIENLRVTGISPFKGEFIHLGDADYNLYSIQQTKEIEAPDQMFYHKAIPYVTVLRGHILRAKLELNDYSGCGTHRSISIPNHFMY
ncbi:hypothetical protein GLW08_17575 [Pontibacillus yanchengensis]|uniref:Uncharacterized protein n=2 Tax=Pontibacillus yanchengensis TaxID=462910 RepID=A0ACC7VJK3_9BACI|nr:hypothetical protein [Pontibacillus yanchengensis]MYL32754.1 hypothetical protein [Pontibacillus yanchengensis]MYL55148.1 hypothetical protein [Pontibacillus yanchengensis]